MTNSERVISRQRAFLPAAGEARADWWIIAQVAARMGWGRQFAWKNPAEIFREHARLTGLANNGRRLFDISGLAGQTDVDYEAMEPTRWPVPATGESTARFFPAGIGAKLAPTPFREAVRTPNADFPLVLNTGRIRDQWHTMTRTGKAPRLSAHLPEPFLTIHPDDAGEIIDGAFVRLDALTGHAILRARIDPGQRPGSVFAPMHWTRQFCPEGRINQSVNAEVDPISGQPELKHTPVRISPWTPEWHGFLLSRERFGADLAEWCAVIPTAVAWRHELAGNAPAETEFERLRGLIPQQGAWITLADPASRMHRAALVQDGVLQAVIFIGPDHRLPERDWLVSLFERERITLDERRSLLAGLPAEGGAPEKPVCVCFGVGASRIRAAIDGGCCSVNEIGAAIQAGTNCGSCKPELRALLSVVAA